MKYRKLGASDLSVSEISLGSWLTFGVGVARERAGLRQRAFELGINFIDTANVYGRGAAETFLGEALAGIPRDSYVLATKVFFPMSEHRPGSVARADRQADRRLARPPQDRSCRSLSVPSLRRRTRRWKKRWAHSAKSCARARRAISASANGRRSISKRRSPFPARSISSPASRNIRCCGAARGESVSALQETGRVPDRVVAAGAGRADGKIRARRRRPRIRAPAATAWAVHGRLDAAAILEAVEKLKPLAKEAGVTLAQFSLAWVLREPNVASAIVGASRPEQLDDNAAASGLVIDPALFAKAEAIVAGVSRAQ
jgi:aryl-alcohol dehydrogenase-like predicted oxidoreductase